MKTTLTAIRSHSPCSEGWRKLLAHVGPDFGDDTPMSIITILDSNGLGDALWCLRAVTGEDKKIRLYMVWCARQVQHLMTDPRSIAALDVAERYAHGNATEQELAAAWAAAWDAVGAARDAAGAAAARAAAGAAAGSAWDAAGAAAGSAWAAAGAAQEKELRRICA